MTWKTAMRAALTRVTCLILCLCFTACSSGLKLIKVKGQLTFNQKVLEVGNGGVTVIFHPVVEPGQSYTSETAVYHKEDGTFEVLGRTEQGIPAGKYKITIHQMMMSPPAAMVQMNERFGANSPIVREIVDETPVTIDLAEFMPK